MVDRYFGQDIIDPYRWMETGSPEFREWMRSQDMFTRAALSRIRGHAAMVERVRHYLQGASTVGYVAIAANDFIYTDRPGDKERFRIMRRAREGGPPNVLVDIEGTKFTSIDYYEPSPSGRYVAYGVSSAGSEDSLLHVIDSQSKSLVVPPIDRAQYGNVAWLPGEEGFLYTRQPQLAPGAPLSDARKNLTVSLRRLSPHAPEIAVFGHGIESSPYVSESEVPRIGLTSESPFAVGVTDRGVLDPMTLAVKLRADLSNGKKPWQIVVRAAAGVSAWGIRGRELFTLESGGAPRFQLVRYTLNEDGSKARRSVLLPETKIVLRDLKVAKDAIYVTALDGGISRLLSVPFDGQASREVSLPENSSINEISADPTQVGCVLKVETWITSPQWLACSASSCSDTGILPPSRFSRPEVTVERTSAKSADGTEVPLTLLIPKSAKRDGTAPTMVYGYGAYGIPLMPNFQAIRQAWFDAGGIMAFAHVRGGGEFGRAWQDAGSKGNKGHSVEDFIACGETILARGLTRREHLGAYGGSAGGVLIGGVVTRRPDLFKAAFVEVGDTNTLRIEQYPDGAQSAEEYGTVKTLEGFRGLLAMDAYHHVVPQTPYPAMMFSTGINDPRVPSWSPAKMAARLQAATTSGRPVLLRVDFEGGHGVGATQTQLAELRADLYSFLLWQLGHPDFSENPGVASTRERVKR